ncbi:MAG: addiction module protein [Comamonadaceae bacterium]|nr:addiction module protein [Burkholderiales bacterium]MEB2349469.1 addiction module protein [Comamonadaceae bacterium]
MSTLVEDISRQALSLSAAERIQLAETLLSTVQEVDAEVEAAWDDEIKRRIIDVDSGAAGLTPAKEVFAELRRMIQ